MKKLSLILCLFALLAGCSSLPVLNVEKPVPSKQNAQPMTLSSVEQAILSSAKQLNWETKQLQSGLIEASITENNQQAIVNISYTQSSFSIQYKGSKNMKYTGEVIDNQYNKWVFHLMRAIQKRLDQLSEQSMS